MYAKYVGGKIVETAATRQSSRPDWPEEEQVEVADDHPDVVAHLNPVYPNQRLVLLNAIEKAVAVDNADLMAMKAELEVQ